MKTRKLVVLAATPIAALLLSACSSTATSDGGHNMSSMGGQSVDITFAQDMIPHHAQAVAMSKLAATKASDPRIKNLASRIQAAQGPEIEMMTGWLKAWGAQVPGDMSMHNMAMPGMMTMEDMAALGQATGADFDAMFLTMMIAHHEGAITQAQAQLAGGSDPAAKELAQAIIDAQTAEIKEMKAILNS